MPIYEYICQECNNQFSLLQSLCPPERKTQCTKCSSTKVKKVISSFSCGPNTGDHVSSGPAPRFGGGGG